MVEVSANTFIGVISGLLGVLLVLTVLLAIFVWFKSTSSVRNRIKKKKPQLKIKIQDFPKTKQQPPSAAYQILSATDPPEFIIPPTPIPTPGTPDSPGFQHKLASFKSTGSQDIDLASSPLGSPTTSPHPFSHHHEAFYRRSASVPSDVFSQRDPSSPLLDHASSSLWRSAISRTVAANVLNMPMRRDRRTIASTNGTIIFCLKYSLVSMELFIKVLDLIDLPLTKEKGVSYPYIQVYLYADNDEKQPLFYEVLNYSREKTCDFVGLTLEKVRSSTLRIVVLDYDKFSKTEFVADVVLALEHVNTEGEEEARHLNIVNENLVKDKGELLISLSYQPNSSQVSVIVLKATGLHEHVVGGHFDYFVKISLMRDGVLNDKRRTRVVKKTRCPVFNEKLVFPVDEHGLRGICLVFEIIHHESRLKQEKIGNVVIGNNFQQRAIGPLELQHFHEMLESPQKQVAESHKIM